MQGEIESALKKICGEAVAVTGAGRTDRGVHAIGQVVTFDVPWKHSLDELTRAVNFNLPADVAVRELTECPSGFHPRFSAKSRTYEYTIWVSDVRQPLIRRFAWHVTHPLDVMLLNQATSYLLGSHDFRAFGRVPLGATMETKVRNVLYAQWKNAGHRYVFNIEANAFLYHMVRRIVMTLVRIGQGKMAPDDIVEMLKNGDAQRVKGLAPACGLCLINVKY